MANLAKALRRHYLRILDTARDRITARTRERAKGALEEVGLWRLVRAAENWMRTRSPDAYLISFPKAGRTWLRLLLGRAIQRHFGVEGSDFRREALEVDGLDLLDRRIPRVVVSHDVEPQWRYPHEMLVDSDRYRRAKVVFLSRDPRDVVVSLFFEQTKRIELYRERMKARVQDPVLNSRMELYRGTLEKFVREGCGSFRSIVAFYNMWYRSQDACEEFLLVRYEDLRAEPVKELRRVLEFLGIERVGPEIVQEAVEFCSFENMRRMELARAFGKSGELATARRPGDSEALKTRKGKVGGYREYLEPETVSELDEILRTSLDPGFGYD